MSADALPTTDPVPAGIAPAAAPPPESDPRPDLPRWEPGPNKLPLTVSWREHIRDLRWIEDVFHHGDCDRYAGKHVAVWAEQVIDSDENLLDLRARLKLLPADAGRRATVTYVPTPIET
jgi:hypothetical protein